MKSIVSYIGSFILSVLLIFSIITSIGVTIINAFANPDKLYHIAQEKNLGHVVYTELEKYYSQRYNTTGIPADVYMNAISENYLDDVIRIQIDNGFYVLMDWEQTDRMVNMSIETALNNFYSDYADSIGAEKDAKYDEKLSEAKANADEIISEYCDVFKLRTMKNHGILKKIAPLYAKLPTLILIAYGSTAFLMLLMIFVNIKSASTTLYWSGISAIISGIIGAVPCIYFKSTNYFSAFTIKQPQIYTAYTTAMNR
ncbi:MAG: hypothetical protein K2I82_01610, partial [Ruminococcus sp.]|nr:hypothetical protein [Ruminococcus sp.]